MFWRKKEHKKSDSAPPAIGLKSQWRLSKRHLMIFVVGFGLIGAYTLLRLFAAPIPYKQLDFNSDPGWEASENQSISPCALLGPYKFGYSATNKVNGSGASIGEIGGAVPNLGQHRAYYAKRFTPAKNLDNRLSASGSLILPVTNEDASVLVGWFNSDSYDWRTNNFLGLRISDSYSSVRPNNGVFVDFATRSNLSGGIVVKNNEGGTGTLPYSQKMTWTLDYQPNQGTYGGFMVSITTSQATYQASYNLTEAQRKDGAIFDRFGIFNMQFGGNEPRQNSSGAWDNGSTKIKTIYLDDIKINIGSNDALVTYSFNDQPSDWEGVKNNDSAPITDCAVRYRQDFGWRSTSSFAGGQAGEVGGVMWNGVSGVQSYYADRVSSLSFSKDILYATGKLVVNHTHPDTDIPYIGWFKQSTSKWGEPTQGNKLSVRNMVGARIGGVSRLGHNLEPTYFNNEQQGTHHGSTNSVEPKTIARDFWICYVPNADGAGNGRLTTGVGAVPSANLPEGVGTTVVKAADKTPGTTFDRFGVISPNVGGAGFTDFYIDNLRYTTASGDSAPDDKCGIPKKYSYSGKVFYDLNNNGKFDSGDQGVANETVLLQKPDGTQINLTTTNTDGDYKLEGLDKGQYRITHKVPSGYQRTTDDSRIIDLGPDVVWDFGMRQLDSSQPPPPPPSSADNGKILFGSDLRQYFIIDGKRQAIGEPIISHCIRVRRGAGTPQKVADSVIKQYPEDSRIAWCNYEGEAGLNFVRERGDTTVWIVQSNGIKRHVGSLCPNPQSLKKWTVFEVPPRETGGHIVGGTWFASTAGCNELK